VRKIHGLSPKLNGQQYMIIPWIQKFRAMDFVKKCKIRDMASPEAPG
jgi:hypothetical protein